MCITTNFLAIFISSRSLRWVGCSRAKELCRPCGTMISHTHGLRMYGVCDSCTEIAWNEQKIAWIHACLVYCFKINNNIRINFVCVVRMRATHTHPPCINEKLTHKLRSNGLERSHTSQLYSGLALGEHTAHSCVAETREWCSHSASESAVFLTLCARRNFERRRRALWAQLFAVALCLVCVATPRARITQLREKAAAPAQNVMEPTMDIVQIHTHTHARVRSHTFHSKRNGGLGASAVCIVLRTLHRKAIAWRMGSVCECTCCVVISVRLAAAIETRRI